MISSGGMGGGVSGSGGGGGGGGRRLFWSPARRRPSSAPATAVVVEQTGVERAVVEILRGLEQQEEAALRKSRDLKKISIEVHHLLSAKERIRGATSPSMV